MKRLIKWVFLILLILFFSHSCVYHYITHMNDEELEWLTNRHEGESMYFQSENGIKDTIIGFTKLLFASVAVGTSERHNSRRICT